MQKFNCIEEKVIFEKLTNKRTNELENCSSNIENNDNNLFNANKISNYISEINGYIKTLEETRQNYAFRPLFSYRKFIGRIIVFCKKVIRKLLKFYVEPIAFQQTEFNNAVTPTIGRMTEIQNELLKGIISLENKFDSVNKDKNELVNNLEVLKGYTDKLEKELEETRKHHTELEKSLNFRLDENNKKFDDIKGYTDKLEKELEETRKHHTELEKSLNFRLDENNKKFDDIKEYTDKLEKELEETRRHYNEVERSLLYKLYENLALQRIANDKIRNNEQKLSKFEELELDINKEKEFNFWDKNTVAQSGEDAICAYINMALGRPLDQCTYLDLGANHAKDLSNTYLFYSHGARGVLVEANPALIPELEFYRSEDIILNKCVTTQSGNHIDFYILSGDGLSTPDLNSAKEFMTENPDLKIVNTIQVETISVNDILKDYFEEAPVIMNIDIEGKDLEILESIDFSKYRPLIIIVEMIKYKKTLVIGNKNTEIIEFMEKNNYIEYAFTGINSIFIDRTQIEGAL